jgi:hypothetical protein
MKATLTNEPDDLLPLTTAAARLPSVRAGRTVHPDTLRRWIAAERLRCWRRGRWLYVSLAECERLAGRLPPPPPPDRRREAELRRLRTEEALRRHGLL